MWSRIPVPREWRSYCFQKLVFRLWLFSLNSMCLLAHVFFRKGKGDTGGWFPSLSCQSFSVAAAETLRNPVNTAIKCRGTGAAWVASPAPQRPPQTEGAASGRMQTSLCYLENIRYEKIGIHLVTRYTMSEIKTKPWLRTIRLFLDERMNELINVSSRAWGRGSCKVITHMPSRSAAASVRQSW